MAKISVEMLAQLVNNLKNGKQEHIILVKIDNQFYFSQVGRRGVIKRLLKEVTAEEPEVLQLLKEVVVEDVLEQIHAQLVSLDAHDKGKVN